MSLPEAKKVISEQPPKHSVASPTSKVEQEKDVDRKLRLYGVIRAFRDGRMPDNEQIDETLLYVRDHSPIDTGELSPDGKKLIADTRNIIETARRFVKEKNADEVVQQFFYHTSGFNVENKKPEIDAPVSEKEARKDAREALNHLRTLFQLLVKNSEARKLLSDLQLIGRGMFADTASTIADRARPPQEALDQVDDAAPTNKFNGSPEPERKSIPTASKPTKEAAVDTSSPIPNSPVTDAIKDTSSEGSSAPAKKTLKLGFQRLTNRVPDKHKERMNAEFENSKQYLKEQFPPERRDQFVYRLKKVVVECQSHPSYQESLSWFLSQLETYFGHGKRVASTGANQTTSLFSDPLLNQAASEMRTFLERCANDQSMSRMFDAMQRMKEDAQEDEDLRNWWSRADAFARKTLLEPGFILAPIFDTQARQLRDEARQFFDFKYRDHRDALIDSIQSWFRAWTEDPLNKRLGDDLTLLYKDLLFDDEGHLAYKPHLWSDIRHFILPAFADKVGYVPIPRIEYTDKDLDLVIENLTLQGRNLFPNLFEMNVQNYVKFSPYRNIGDEHHHTVTMTLSQIQADMRDVAFYYRKKGGLRISDSGLADVFLGGKGITVKVVITSSTADRQGGESIFKVKSVVTKVDALKFSVRDSKHNLLYKTLRPLATGLIKKQISKAISDAIRSGLEFADSQLVEVQERMAEANASEDGSKRQALKDMWAARKDETEAKAHAKKARRKSHFRIVSKRDSMLLPEAGHERGWINKQAEREDAVLQGEGWKSKAFSIIPTSA